MNQVVLIDHPGGPDVLRVEQRAVPEPGQGEVLVRQAAAGVNFIDVQHRTGRYPIASYPAPIGMEGAGVVEAVGAGVTDWKPGDRVAYASGPLGGYAQWKIEPDHRLVAVPSGIDLELAAGSVLRGLTAQYLITGSYEVKAGDVLLVHAAAGGVGQILTQWVKHLGATVIATVGSDDKAEIARRNGCDHVINYSREDFAARARELTNGRGVDVVYDAVGPGTFEGSLKSLRKRGLLVSYGTASGPLPPLDLFRLNGLGSLYVTSQAFLTYTADRDELRMRARHYFDVLLQGIVKVDVHHRYPLAQAAQAHIDLQARRTTGPIVLTA